MMTSAAGLSSLLAREGRLIPVQCSLANCAPGHSVRPLLLLLPHHLPEICTSSAAHAISMPWERLPVALWQQVLARVLVEPPHNQQPQDGHTEHWSAPAGKLRPSRSAAAASLRTVCKAFRDGVDGAVRVLRVGRHTVPLAGNVQAVHKHRPLWVGGDDVRTGVWTER